MKKTFSLLVVAIVAAIFGAITLYVFFTTGTISFRDAPANASHASLSNTKAVQEKYHCPMHPEIIRDAPGTCPICGMDLVPMKISEAEPNEDSTGSDAVHIEASMIQNLGVTTLTVTESEITKMLRLNGTIVIHPEKIAVINARTMGWIESIPRGTEGSRVYAGQTLASFYSPDLVAAEEDFIQALEINEESIVTSARKRLEVLGIPQSLVDSIQKSRKVWRTVPIQARISGVVLKRFVVQGQNIMPGSDLYRIADLSHVWAVGIAYPDETRGLREGMEVIVSVQGLETTPRKGKIVFVSPTVDPVTKTTEIRVDIQNTRNLAYKPGMNADIRIHKVLGHGIAIPSQAVIHTGERTLTIMALGNGAFAPRELTLGESLGDSVQVLQGLNAGDVVVTSAQFLIDSESNLKKAVRAFEKKGESHDSQNH